ncbi:DnaJ domain-containing protein [Natrialba sp. INN-245]|uniref:DnaJ domain-containing protein n=1 Tax=Natrialba sp. INN-245 TaxID=2690967 RepID=UPI00131320F9|nr:DnaJ domain-containing protein [Natrialba sp. INN-245]MWV39451.1 DnaJ domain-containing protein [Natrialba sp. INN-245]
MTADFYDLLEIPPDASAEEIKEAYREKVRIYHPDVNDDDRARSQFTAVKKANDVLGDPVERRAYDRLGHETYVAKRTSGIPSPDVWADADSDSSTDDEPKAADDDRGTSNGSGENRSERRGGDRETEADEPSDSSRTSRSRFDSRGTESVGGSRADDGTTTQTDGSERTGTTNTGRTSSTRPGESGTTNTDGTASTDTGTRTARAGGAKTAETGGTASSGRSVSSTDGGTAKGHRPGGDATSRGAASHSSRDTAGASVDASPAAGRNPVVRWWRRQNFALPLIWLSVLVYAIGVGQYALANESAVGSLRDELAAVGASAGGLWTVLSSGRYGLETPLSFVTTVEPVTPMLASPQWHLVLAGVVVAAIAAVVLTRPIRRERLWAPISMDETILVSAALAVSTGLIGGPLLAGALLMPFLFGVVVYHTRRGPGWTPSYLYVLPVLAPAAGFVVSAAGYATLPIELVAFVVLPVVGALGLPLRATVRKHFDR